MLVAISNKDKESTPENTEGVPQGIVWTPEDEVKLVNYLQKQVMDYYGYEREDVSIVEVKTKEEFIDWWNHELPDEVDALVMQLHGSPEGILFKPKDYTDKDTLSTRELMQELDYKDIKVMVDLSCNLLGKRGDKDDTETEKQRPPYAFQYKGVQNQIASKGTVEIYRIDQDTYYYTSEESGKFGQVGETDYFYTVTGSGDKYCANRQFDVEGKNSIKGTDIPKNEIYTITDILGRYDLAVENLRQNNY